MWNYLSQGQPNLAANTSCVCRHSSPYFTRTGCHHRGEPVPGADRLPRHRRPRPPLRDAAHHRARRHHDRTLPILRRLRRLRLHQLGDLSRVRRSCLLESNVGCVGVLSCFCSATAAVCFRAACLDAMKQKRK